MTLLAKTTRLEAQLVDYRKALAATDTPDDAIKIGAGVAGIEQMMRKSSLYQIDELRPVRELFLDSRWTLGKLLKKILPRPNGQRRGSGVSRLPQKKAELERLNLTKPTAIAAERISALPEKEKAKAYKDAATQEVLPTIEMLIDVARPFWYQESRRDKHRAIAAEAAAILAPLGPFPLIYADPPWKFETYSEKGLERTPDQHYPTLTDDEIINFKIGEKTVPQIAHTDAALLLWCTSSNMVRALGIMAGWGFEYKSNAVWDKGVGGTGLVFRNWHELLLYGTRGNMPGPQYQPPSVFRYLRLRHSEKPAEIRIEVEKMYPDFPREQRLELFARGVIEGWTAYGYEAVC